MDKLDELIKAFSNIKEELIKAESEPNMASPNKPKGLDNKKKPVTHDDCGRPFAKGDEVDKKIKAKLKAEMDKRNFGEADATRHVIDRDRGDKVAKKPKVEPLLQSELVKALADAGFTQSALLLKNWNEMDSNAELMKSKLQKDSLRTTPGGTATQTHAGDITTGADRNFTGPTQRSQSSTNIGPFTVRSSRSSDGEGSSSNSNTTELNVKDATPAMKQWYSREAASHGSNDAKSLSNMNNNESHTNSTITTKRTMNKSNYGPKTIDGEKVSMYNTKDNIKRKAGRTGVEVEGAGGNKAQKEWASGGRDSSKSQLNREVKENKAKNKKQPVKTMKDFSPEEIKAMEDKVNKEELAKPGPNLDPAGVKSIKDAFGGGSSDSGPSMWDKVKDAFSGPSLGDSITDSIKRRGE